MKTQCQYKEQINTSTFKNGSSRPATTTVCGTPVQLRDETELSLQELLQICLQTGESEQWNEFVRRSQPLIAGVVTKTVRSWTKPGPDLIDDLVQETFVKLCCKDFRVLRRFVPRHENALHGFLKVLASNTARDHFRHAYNQEHGRGTAEVQFDHLVELRVHNQSFESFDRRILLQEIYKNLLRHCSSSPNLARDQKVFWLYYKHGLTAKAISQLRSIGLSLKGVESAIFRIVRHLRLTMRDQPRSIFETSFNF